MRSHVNKSDQQVNVYFFFYSNTVRVQTPPSKDFCFSSLTSQKLPGISETVWKVEQRQMETQLHQGGYFIHTADGGQDSRKHKDIYQSLTSE